MHSSQILFGICMCYSAPHPPPPTGLLASPLLFTAISRADIWDILEIISFHFSVNHYMALGFYWCSWFSGPRSGTCLSLIFFLALFLIRRQQLFEFEVGAGLVAGVARIVNPASFPVFVCRLSSDSVHVSKNVFLFPSHLSNILLGC